MGMFKSSWYYSLAKPSLSPPNWVFPPVWAFFYFTMFVALFLYILKSDGNKKSGYIFFAVQFALNLLWTPAFFLLKNIFAALIIVILLDIFVFLNLKSFYKVSKPSGLILIPYFIWVIYATYLNLGYLILND